LACININRMLLLFGCRYSYWSFCEHTWTCNQLQYRSTMVRSYSAVRNPQSWSNVTQSRTWPYSDSWWR